jgi:hypothetical protein
MGMIDTETPNKQNTKTTNAIPKVKMTRRQEREREREEREGSL